MLRFLHYADRALALIEKLLEWFISILVVILVAILALKLIDRHLFDIPISAPDEYAKIALVWVTFLGFALAVRANVNIRVDLIEPRLPPFAKRTLAILFDLVLLILASVVLVTGWPYTEIAMDKIILGTDLPEAVPNAALIVSMSLIIAFAGRRLIARLRGEAIAHGHDQIANPD